ncbi:Zinc/iron permease [Cordyceps fumosorosea ARSEF 2679]|uniref:Zinc/iron permease n=1 Tax=Cordyceps fumosorosea (strain ARSEF 2679) TaxID=1081104 RepID=A0A167V655_CORFA|nr:Zinc/iron permease [Cordyceps fumosorosea ARSEF 2679]OAA62267.1 Zinc/iron permease [Cordyceps fumosorosea ARSEF 2679]
MICLSKADEHALRHLSFNQSPPALAPGQTTCEDLNGMANLREHVAADQDDGGGGNAGLCGADAQDERLRHASPEPELPKAAEAGWWWNGPSLSSRTAVLGGPPASPASPSSQRTRYVWGWVTWISSVLVVSSVLSSLREPSSRAVVAPAFSSSPGEPTMLLLNDTATSAVSSAAPALLAAAATSGPLRKRSTCATGGVGGDEYNTPLHVGALFIILFVSFTGCAFPLLAVKFPRLRIPARFFFVVRHFGTGVLIATAFVHLLPTAFVSLGNPCLSSFWTKDYPAMPGAIALSAVFLVTVIEMVFHPSRRIQPEDIALNGGGGHQGCMANVAFVAEGERGADGSVTQPIRDMGPIGGRQSSVGQNLTQLSRSLSTSVDTSRDPSRIAVTGKNDAVLSSDEDSFRPPTLSAQQQLRRERLQCILLELGILFHSVFIGMALSVSVGNEFIVLLIAITFHQTFEGLALGSRIAAVKWEKQTIQPWLMALAYGCTTPLGQAIGLATHTLYSPDSEVGLILVGVMNAISAGLLTFASLVELLSEDFLSDASWRYLRGKSRVGACILVFLGAFGMSLVGAWA